ncbi:MAG: hypothetical protein CL693_16360 [Cellvibrionaceae bacterium]|nr:hypothetical protein [Cellvibrionaceae bacterium]|tara:strand:- start:350 stop:583 length:234 start_codon:yes stop_codon:yes gene_type:complete
MLCSDRCFALIDASLCLIAFARIDPAPLSASVLRWRYNNAAGSHQKAIYHFNLVAKHGGGLYIYQMELFYELIDKIE